MTRRGKGRRLDAAGPLASGSKGQPSASRVEDVEIDDLHELDLDGLRRRWRSEFGRAAPNHLTKLLMARVLAYRLQADRLGDLSASAVQVIESLLQPSAEKSKGGKATISVSGRLSVGTTLVREHDGTRHHVKVVDAGFAWSGTVYSSLTKVAYAITGTNWNGPRFFGLRDKAKVSR